MEFLEISSAVDGSGVLHSETAHSDRENHFVAEANGGKAKASSSLSDVWLVTTQLGTTGLRQTQCNEKHCETKAVIEHSPRGYQRHRSRQEYGRTQAQTAYPWESFDQRESPKGRQLGRPEHRGQHNCGESRLRTSDGR